MNTLMRSLIFAGVLMPVGTALAATGSTWPSWIGRTTGSSEPVNGQIEVPFSYEYNGPLPSYAKTAKVYNISETDTVPNIDAQSVIGPYASTLGDLAKKNIKTSYINMMFSDAVDATTMIAPTLMISANGFTASSLNDHGTCESATCMAKFTTESLKSIAKNFLKTHGIDTKNFGSPIMGTRDNSIADEDSGWFFDQKDIIYPQLLEGKQVYMKWDNHPAGLTISIAPSGNVTTLGLVRVTPTTSESAATATQEAIRAALAQPSSYWIDEGESKKERYIVKLGTPTLAWYRLYRPEMSSQIVPAIVFAVKDNAGLSYIGTSYILPLVGLDAYQEFQGGLF